MQLQVSYVNKSINKIYTGQFFTSTCLLHFIIDFEHFKS